MNDEQFESVMQQLENHGGRYAMLVLKLRARDTAQREALARVEAENEQMASKLLEIAEQRDAAQAQLAQAVGILDRLSAYKPQGICAPTAVQGFAIEAASFLARHAQAEQQEAQPQFPLQNPRSVKFQAALEKTFQKFEAMTDVELEEVVAAHMPQQEAQGAQADMELVGYANFDQLDNMLEDRTAILHPKKTGFAGTPVYRARAALATQPAAYVLTKDGEIYWEGDDGIVISNTPGDCLDDSYEWRPVGFISQPALPAPAEAMSFEYADLSGERRTVTVTRDEVIEGMEDALYEKLGAQICRCEPIGETNVVECNCQDYIEEFALVSAKPAVRGAEHE